MIEAAYMIPIVLMVWMLVIFGLFYYHDKQILSGAAYEAAVAGSLMIHEEGEAQTERIEQYFRKRIQGKLLFFRESAVVCEIMNERENITVRSRATSKRMSVLVQKKAAVTDPEKRIRFTEAGKSIKGEVFE